MELEHCMPCPPPEIDAKAALSKLTLLVTEFANRRGTPSISRIDVFKEDMETLDEITRVFRQVCLLYTSPSPRD